MRVTVYRYSNDERIFKGYWFSFRRYKDFDYYGRSEAVGGKFLHEYQIKIDNPFIFEVDKCASPTFPLSLYKHLFLKDNEDYLISPKERYKSEEQMAKLLKSEGYDSVIFKSINCVKYGMTDEHDYIELWLLNPVYTYENYARSILI